jgi:hypothetical protein
VIAAAPGKVPPKVAVFNGMSNVTMSACPEVDPHVAVPPMMVIAALHVNPAPRVVLFERPMTMP